MVKLKLPNFFFTFSPSNFFNLPLPGFGRQSAFRIGSKHATRHQARFEVGLGGRIGCRLDELPNSRGFGETALIRRTWNLSDTNQNATAPLLHKTCRKFGYWRWPDLRPRKIDGTLVEIWLVWAGKPLVIWWYKSRPPFRYLQTFFRMDSISKKSAGWIP